MKIETVWAGLGVEVYNRGRNVTHRGCAIRWEIAPMCEVISDDPPVMKLTMMPRIPEVA